MRTQLLLLAALGSASASAIGCGPAASGTGDGGGGGGGGGTADAPGSVIDAPVLPVPDGAPAPSSGVTIIVEPNGNKASELVSAIAAAHTSVYMTMYALDNPDIIGAMVARAQAGVDVQVVLDSSTTNKSSNTAAYNKIKTAGGKPVWSSSTFTYTHEKTVIIDGATAWIMTMNAEVSSVSDNREYLAIDTNAADVAEATAVFKADHALQSITPTGDLIVANVNARPQLVALINSATTTLDVEGEEFSDTNQNGIVIAVVAAARRGVTVHVIVSTGNQDTASDKDVKTAGGHVVVTGPTSGNGTPTKPYIHAKAVLVDCVSGTCARGFVGSENFSAGSLGYNRELGVVFAEPTELAKVKAAIDTDFAAGVAQ